MWQLRRIATRGRPTSRQSFWGIARPIMHQPTNSTIIPQPPWLAKIPHRPPCDHPGGLLVIGCIHYYLHTLCVEHRTVLAGRSETRCKLRLSFTSTYTVSVGNVLSVRQLSHWLIILLESCHWPLSCTSLNR